MSKQMLIDASHAEETRVVVVDGTQVEDFDFESRNRKQLRGNIYLAKVTRVEPSLQAAFIEYGGNRHGFLAFDEIHPDYYQIPLADREALMREVEADDDDHHPAAPPVLDENGDPVEIEVDDEDDVDEQAERRRRRLLRRYKIQEVIRRRQIMLVQVVKEERGNKGAALTTYLSLAGRYGVLMPNTARGGGISRKITTATDRKRLKSVVASLEVPQGMGLIVRTAGAKRTKAELKRDYDYLMRLWENIRDTTMHSVAPALIYEEEDLVKRVIRDLYDKDIEGVWVEGEAGFREARDFMRMLMPSQAKKVQLYTDAAPLFVREGVEEKLSQIYSPSVALRSGGYIVINQTEALVAVDVNSGRATRERNIEATALKTNMEAAEETARQLRLRDLAGLIVIDFIDMEESKNNRAVEKKLKDALAEDRARIQMGRISSFGLMEISRQRRRSGVLEGTTHICEHCQGVGRVRSVESAALSALRALELEAMKGGGEARLKVPAAVGLYILNEKRAHLGRLEDGLRLFVSIVLDDALAHADHEIERTSSEPRPTSAVAAPKVLQPYEPSADDLLDEDEPDDEEVEAEADAPLAETRAPREERDDGDIDADADGHRSRGRRRRRGRGGDEAREPRVAAEVAVSDAPAPAAASDDEDEDSPRRRRRGRRGGRRAREDAPRAAEPFGWTRPRVPYAEDPFVWHDLSVTEGPAPARAAPTPANDAVAPSLEAAAPIAPAIASSAGDDIWVELPAAEEKPKRARRSRGRARGGEAATAEPAAEAPLIETPVAAPTEAPQPVAEAPVALEPAAEPVAPKRRSRAKPKPAEATEAVEAVAPVETAQAPQAAAEPEPEPVLVAANIEPEPVRPPDPAEISTPPAAPRRGWWRRGG